MDIKLEACTRVTPTCANTDHKSAEIALSCRKETFALISGAFLGVKIHL